VDGEVEEREGEMRVYGNLANRIAESTRAPQPTVGMGATLCYFSDRHAATVIEVSENGKRIVVQQDKATRTDSNGMSESQTYEYAADPAGAKTTFTLRKNGRWVESGSAMKNGTGLRLGEREEYFDFGF
jgi:hypothetical protein